MRGLDVALERDGQQAEDEDLGNKEARAQAPQGLVLFLALPFQGVGEPAVFLDQPRKRIGLEITQDYPRIGGLLVNVGGHVQDPPPAGSPDLRVRPATIEIDRRGKGDFHSTR